MFDGIDACFQANLDAFGAFDMGRGAKPEFMSLVAHRLRDIEGMRKTPGSPSTSASKTPPVMKSLI